MSRRFVNELNNGDSVDDVFLVVQKQTRANRQGNHYLFLELRDRTGSLDARLWNVPENTPFGFAEGDYVRARGKVQLFQGALQIRQTFANAVLIFILPPSWEELRSRLERRGEDSPEVIEVRLKNAAAEMAQAHQFDFVIINELFERALFDLKAIAHAQRLKYAAQRRARASTFESLNIP